MRAMDLEDLVAKREAVDKVAYKARLAWLLRSQRAKEVAARTMCSLRKACVEVQNNGGAASSG